MHRLQFRINFVWDEDMYWVRTRFYVKKLMFLSNFHSGVNFWRENFKVTNFSGSWKKSQKFSLRTQTYSRLSFLSAENNIKMWNNIFVGEKRQPERRLRLQAAKIRTSKNLVPHARGGGGVCIKWVSMEYLFGRLFGKMSPHTFTTWEKIFFSLGTTVLFIVRNNVGEHLR